MATESANFEELLAQISENNGNHAGAIDERAIRERNIARVRLFWNRRELLGRVAGWDFLLRY